MLNDQSLTIIQHKQFQEIFQTVIRLSKMNEALLLLSKIENRQFAEKSDMDLSQLIQSRIVFLEELFELKEISLTLRKDAPFITSIHPMLADILINNLLSNALKHNYSHGQIIITTGINEITFSNTGNPLTIDPSKIFNRFVKQSTSEASNGLGLAIADEICRSNQLLLNYTYSEPFHIFTLSKVD